MIFYFRLLIIDFNFTIEEYLAKLMRKNLNGSKLSDLIEKKTLKTFKEDFTKIKSRF